MESLINNINNLNYDVNYTIPSHNLFRYVVIDNFLKSSYHEKLLNEAYQLKSEGRFVKFNVSYAPEGKSNWSMAGLGDICGRHSHFHLFSTQSFKNFITDMFRDIELTNNITMELHHHPVNDNSGWIHNDFDQANFVNDGQSTLNGLNIWNNNSRYRAKENVPDYYEKNARSIALIYYMDPESINWKKGDGGDTGLYTNPHDDVDNHNVVSVSPIPNRLLVYEINPYSWHALKMENKYERLSFHMWYHSDLEYSINKWRYTGHSPLD